MAERTRKGTPYREVSRTRTPKVSVVDTVAGSTTTLRGRGYGKMLARQLAESYMDAGLRVDGSSAHGFTVSDRYGVRGRVDVVDQMGAFGQVALNANLNLREGR